MIFCWSTLIEAPNVPSSPRNGLGHVHALFSARSCSMVLRGRKRLRALPNLSSVSKDLCGTMVSQWGMAAQTNETNQDGIVTKLHLTCHCGEPCLVFFVVLGWAGGKLGTLGTRLRRRTFSALRFLCWAWWGFASGFSVPAKTLTSHRCSVAEL